jgi:glycerophosphoryl diester phosphodiesterase
MIVSLLCAAIISGHPGFAHNDYAHPRPLLDSLEAGFQYVEADVFLVDGKLLVAHDLKDVKPERSLEDLYLKPLSERKEKLPGKPFWLMVDIKADGNQVYPVLDRLLEKYRPMLVKWTDAGPSGGAVAIVLSGNRPVGLVAAQKERWVAIDGRPEDLSANRPVGLVPWISTSYLGFKWPLGSKGTDAKGYVETAHKQGRKVRFWAIPDSPASWNMQREMGIDLINTDRPKEFQAWVKGKQD